MHFPFNSFLVPLMHSVSVQLFADFLHPETQQWMTARTSVRLYSADTKIFETLGAVLGDIWCKSGMLRAKKIEFVTRATCNRLWNYRYRRLGLSCLNRVRYDFYSWSRRNAVEETKKRSGWKWGQCIFCLIEFVSNLSSGKFRAVGNNE